MRTHTKARLLNNRSFQQVVVWGMLLAVTVSVLYVIVTSIPHAYASYGVAVFLIVAIPAGLFASRRRWMIIGVSAATIAVVVITLHFVAMNRIVVENRTGQSITRLEIQVGRNRSLPMNVIGFFPGRKVTFKYHDLSSPQSISIRAVLEDGSTIPADRAEFFFTPDQWQATAENSSRRISVGIGPHDIVTVTPL